MKNFAAQGDSQLNVLTGRELTTEVTPNPNIFDKRPLFVDNCKDCNMKNANGDYAEYGGGESNADFWSGVTFGDVFKIGTDIWSSEQERKTAEEQAQLALQIERERFRQEQAKAAAEKAKADSLAGRIKAYGLPIAIGGVVVIGGIAAYFYFKKKKG